MPSILDSRSNRKASEEQSRSSAVSTLVGILAARLKTALSASESCIQYSVLRVYYPLYKSLSGWEPSCRTITCKAYIARVSSSYFRPNIFGALSAFYSAYYRGIRRPLGGNTEIVRELAFEMRNNWRTCRPVRFSNKESEHISTNGAPKC